MRVGFFNGAKLEHSLRRCVATGQLPVLLPEFVSDRWWHALLHNQTTLMLKGALLFHPGIMVTSVPYHLRGNRRSREPSERERPAPIGSSAD